MRRGTYPKRDIMKTTIINLYQNSGDWSNLSYSNYSSILGSTYTSLYCHEVTYTEQYANVEIKFSGGGKIFKSEMRHRILN